MAKSTFVQSSPPGIAHSWPAGVFALVHILLLPILTGCGDSDFRPIAIGAYDEVTVIVDSARWYGEVGEALRGEIGAYIGTLPAPEPSFGFRAAEMENGFDDLRKFKNIIITAVLSDSTAEAQFIRDRLPEGTTLEPDQSLFIVRDDLWRRGQKVVYLAAPSQASLVRAIHEYGEDLRYVFSEQARSYLQAEMFEKGRQEHLEDTLMAHHGFAVNVQHDYQIAIDTTIGNTGFIWLRRILADTWRDYFIWYKENADPSVLTPEWIYATRDSLTEQFLRGNLGGWVEIVYPPIRELETENVNFIGRYGFETRGLWEMIGRRPDGSRMQFAQGGPFINYTFYDEATGRIYMLDGMVFAPGHDKREFLRQMEVISHTFRTRQDVQRQEATVAANE